MPFFLNINDMNPATINTTNVLQFGFRATFDLENAKLILDISNLTIFKPGGGTAIVGINFSVIDPSGVPLSLVDFPNTDISPTQIGAGQLTYEVQLSNSPSQYGWYIIKGVLREADGHDYSVEVTKEICSPKGIKNGIVPGIFDYQADCTIPKLTIVENTNFSYKGLYPISTIKNGVLYYPQGTLAQVAFTYTPFEIIGSGKIYTGDYIVRNKSVSLYDLGDNVFVNISYSSTKKFTVNCNTNICDILCCIEKLQSVVEKDPTTIQGRDAKQKLNEVALPLVLALSMEKCGKNAGDLIEDIAEKLNCSCNCDGAESIEPKAIITSFDPVVLDGVCATTTTLEGGIWKIKTKAVTVVNADTGDQAFVVSGKETDCAITYSVEINKNLLTGDILNEIKNSPTLKNIFNSLIEESPLDFSGLDGKCIIDSTDCTYQLSENATDASKTVLNIIIDGITYAAPTGLGIRNGASIKSWLNGLNKGTFDAFYDSTSSPVKTVITSENQTHVIGTMTFVFNGENIIRQVPKICLGLLQILQAIIDYLCDLDDSQVKLSKSYNICYVDNAGDIKTKAVSTITGSTATTQSQLMTAFLDAYCTSLNSLKSLMAINCSTIKNIFVATDAIKVDDALLGTRNGKCGMWSRADFARAFLEYMTTTNDEELINMFCELRNKCVTFVCSPVTFAEVELIEPCPGISTISGSFTN